MATYPMTLSAPWDKAALVADLKSKGIADAEKLAEVGVDSVMSWALASTVMLAPTQPLYGLAAVVIPQIDLAIDAAIEAQIAKA